MEDNGMWSFNKSSAIISSIALGFLFFVSVHSGLKNKNKVKELEKKLQYSEVTVLELLEKESIHNELVKEKDNRIEDLNNIVNKLITEHKAEYIKPAVAQDSSCNLAFNINNDENQFEKAMEGFKIAKNINSTTLNEESVRNNKLIDKVSESSTKSFIYGSCVPVATFVVSSVVYYMFYA